MINQFHGTIMLHIRNEVDLCLLTQKDVYDIN